MQTLRDALDTHADARPDAPFILAPEPDTALTFEGLRRSACALHGVLARRGIVEGDVVSYMLPNGISAATVFLGAMYGGYVASPISLLAQDAQIEYVLAHSGTRIVFAAPEFVEGLRALAAKIGARTEIVSTAPDDPGFAEPAARLALPSLASATPAMLMYTSGTTGVPKGALLSHGNMLHAGRSVTASLALTAEDRVLSSLPLYHINGQCIATVSPLVSGGSNVMPHRFSVSQWWTLVERHRPTWLNMVPTIIAYLINGPELTPGQRDACRNLRFGRSASAPLPPDQHRAFESRFGVSVIEAMGMTETASVSFSNPLDPAGRKYGSVGPPLGMEARVVAPDAAQCAVGTTGEVQLRGANVMLGYFHDPANSAKAISADGWFATGDLGHRDADGYYYITGRLKELIIKGGENIAPREIDEALLKHPAVLEAAAVGIPDRDYGQEILACIVLKPQAACTLDELRAHCLRELGRYKTPKEIRIVAELPKGPSGKVQRLKLVGV